MSQKVDLTLLKKFVTNLEESLNAAEKLRGAEDNDTHATIMEFAKASGLAAGIMQEASMLVGDIQSLIKRLQSPPGVADIFSKLLSGGSGPGDGSPFGGFGGGNAN